eukprot:jgi/Mesen1/6001/ME000304S05005
MALHISFRHLVLALACLAHAASTIGPAGAARHPPGAGHHPPGVGHHETRRGHHPPGTGHHATKKGHHPPGVGHHRYGGPPLAPAPAPGGAPPAMPPSPSPPAGGSDACALIPTSAQDGSQAVRVSVARACLNSFPYNATLAANVLDTVSKYVGGAYAFESLVRREQDPHLSGSVDLRASLAAVAARGDRGEWATDRQFQQAVHDVLASAFDTHLRYESGCYQTFAFSHAFPLQATQEGGRQAITDATEDRLDVLLEEYDGLEVAAIDGVDALEYIQRTFVDGPVGDVRDASTRFNEALGTLREDDSFSPGDFAVSVVPPAKNHTLLRLRGEDGSEEDVNVPYFALYLSSNSFQDAPSFYRTNCLPAFSSGSKSALNTARGASSAAGAGGGGSAAARRRAVSLGARARSPTYRLPSREQVTAGARASPRDVVEPRQAGDGDLYFPTDDLGNSTAVIQIPDFIGVPGVVDADKWASEFVSSIRRLKKAGATKLIIDLTNNPGGYVYLAQAAASFLFPSDPSTPEGRAALPVSPAIFRATPLIELLVNATLAQNEPDSSFFYGRYADAASARAFTSAAGFFYPTSERSYSGVEEPYSAPLKEPFEPLEANQTAGPPLFAASNILLVSDGTCVSGCATFAVELTQRFGVRSVFLGGLAGRPGMVYNGAGGTILDNEEVEADMLLLGLDPASRPEVLPLPFATRALLTFPVQAGFGPANTTFPAEFVWRPAEFQLLYTVETIGGGRPLYLEVAKHF